MRLAAAVLAAGSARRFGGDKLAASFHGEPLLVHAIRAARAAPVERVFVVAAQGLEPGDWPGEPHVIPVPLASPELSASLRAGVAAAAGFDGLFVFLGDMPLVPHGIAADLAQALADNIADLPRCQDRTGHPVLFAARAFPELASLTGDSGAGSMLRGRSDVAFVEVADEGVLLDVDRAEDIARLEARGSVKQ